MAAPSLDDLLTVPSQDAVLEQEVLPELRSRGVRTTDWEVGAVTRCFAYVVALLRRSVRLALAAMTAAGFEDYVFGVSTPPANDDGTPLDVTGWAPMVAWNRYGVVRNEATYTKRLITLTNTSTSAYGPLQPGTMILHFPSGKRYVLDDVVTIPAAVGGNPGVVQASFRSEFPTNSAAGLVYQGELGLTSIVLLTANYPGVTASNPIPVYSKVEQSGAGIGKVTVSGTPSGSHTVALHIDTGGTVAAGTVRWSTKVDTGGWVAHTGGSASNLGGVTGLNCALDDNSGSPAFIAGDIYYWNTPGTDITQIGADVETAQSLGIRCRGLWPSLAFPKDPRTGLWIPMSPTCSAYEALALSCNDHVRLVFVDTDRTILNKVNLIIAGQGGAALLPGDVASVQSFFNAWDMITDKPFVQTSTECTITLDGLTVTAKASQITATQNAMDARVGAYFGGADLAVPLSINGRVDYDYIIALVRTTPGVTKVGGTLRINGIADDLQLGPAPLFESARWAQQVATAFTWTTV